MSLSPSRFLFSGVFLGAILAAQPALAQTTRVITLDDGSETCEADLVGLEIDPVSGAVTARVSSLGDCAATTGGGPVIDSFTVNGQQNVTVDAGDDANVAWASSNTTSCAAGGTLPNWSAQGSGLAATGTFLASTSGLANNDWTLTLTCTGPEGLVQVTTPPRVVKVQNSSSGGQCSNFPPPPNVTRASDIIVNRVSDATQFASVLGGIFPGNGTSEQVRMADGQYAAMEFTTGQVAAGASGNVQSTILQPIQPNTASNAAIRMWSVSTCPGDFRADNKDAGCAKGGAVFPGQTSIKFGGSDALADDQVCALESNTTYFLNLLYTEQFPPTSAAEHAALESQCSEQFCGNTMVATGNGFGT